MTYPVHMLNDLLAAVKAIETDAFDRGRAEQRETGKNTPLAQINRMSRQIDECHATIRTRNQTILNYDKQVRDLFEAKADYQRAVLRLIRSYLCPATTCTCYSCVTLRDVIASLEAL